MNIKKLYYSGWLAKVSYMFGIALMLASVVMNAFPPKEVSACSRNWKIQASAASPCQANGKKTITWYVKNDWSSEAKIESISFTNGGTELDKTKYSFSGFGSDNIPTYNNDYSTKDTDVYGGSYLWGMLTGTMEVNGDVTGTIVMTVNIKWTDTGNTETKSVEVALGDTCPVPYQLNISHIACVDGQVEIHFILSDVPDGITPGDVNYTYGSIAPGKHVGNVWHYYDTKPDGYYDITSATVDVGGRTVNLHNPSAYAGSYNCAPSFTASGSSTCEISTGKKIVTWTIDNPLGVIANITKVEVFDTKGTPDLGDDTKVDVAIDTIGVGTPIPATGSVTGTQTIDGTLTGTLRIHVEVDWGGGVKGSADGTAELGATCKVPQLGASVGCVNGQTQIKFTLSDVPANKTPGNVNFVYEITGGTTKSGSLTPGSSYTGVLDDGYYKIKSATVVLTEASKPDITISLANPETYTGTLNCSVALTARGNSDCEISTGKKIVTWTIDNPLGVIANITKVEVFDTKGTPDLGDDTKVDVAIDTIGIGTPIPATGSVTGTQTIDGTLTGTLRIHVEVDMGGGVKGSADGTAELGATCKVPQLGASVGCVNGQTQIKFTLSDVPANKTPGNVNFVYEITGGTTKSGSLTPGSSYTGVLDDGYYKIKSATVVLTEASKPDITISLANPETYTGTLNCSVALTARGNSDCEISTGKKIVTWTIDNPLGVIANITKVEVFDTKGTPDLGDDTKVDVAIDTIGIGTPIPATGSVTGTQTIDGTLTGTLRIHVEVDMGGGVKGSADGTAELGATCKVPQLGASVGCVNGQTQIKFTLSDVPANKTPGNVNFVYEITGGTTKSGSLTPGSSYTGVLDDGYYKIKSATVVLTEASKPDITISLANPETYTGTLNCSVALTARGNSDCEISTGKKIVTWTIDNPLGVIANITKVEVFDTKGTPDLGDDTKVDVAIDTIGIGTPIPATGSVTGTQTIDGTLTGTLRIHVEVDMGGGVKGSADGTAELGATCKASKLGASVGCVNGQTQIKFTLSDVPANKTPGNVNFVYEITGGTTKSGSLTPGSSYTGVLDDGYYKIKSATVVLTEASKPDITISLANPETYTGTLNCSVALTARGNSDCEISTGKKVVTWTIDNPLGVIANITKVEVFDTKGTPDLGDDTKVDVAIDTIGIGTPIPATGSVTGTQTIDGTLTGTLRIHVEVDMGGGVKGSADGTAELGAICKIPQLDIASIGCVKGKTQIQFNLINVPAGMTPGNVTYDYGTITPKDLGGGNWQYIDTKPDGTYVITTASVVIGGVTFNLHNPSAILGTYNCSPVLTANGNSGCEAITGKRDITWNIENDYGSVATINSIKVYDDGVLIYTDDGDAATKNSMDITGITVGSTIAAKSGLTKGSISGTQTLNGTITGSIRIQVDVTWADGNTGSANGYVTLSETCSVGQLDIASIQCVNGQTQIKFDLMNVPAGVTPGSITYTYGTIAPTNYTSGVWHFITNKPDGTYNITSASVVVNGVTITLHNPGTYSGIYNCVPTPTATSTSTATPTKTATPTNTATATNTATPTATNTGTLPPTATPIRTLTQIVVNTPTRTSTLRPPATNTPVPTATNTPTPTTVPTLAAPIPVTGGNNQQLLIPVTGMDLTENGFNKTSKIMMNFGFGFIGLGLILQGFGKKKEK